MQANTGRLLLAAAFVIGLLALMSLPVMATPVTLDSGNSALASHGYYGPYATVTLNLEDSKNTIDVTIQAEDSYYLWGKNHIFAFNYDGSKLQLSPNVEYTNGQPGSEFGKFAYVLDAKKNLKNTTSLSFTLTNPTGFFRSVDDILIPNEKGYVLMTHVAPISNTNNTGAVAGKVSPVPEPGSLALLGAGLVSLGGFMRRFRR